MRIPILLTVVILGARIAVAQPDLGNKTDEAKAPEQIRMSLQNYIYGLNSDNPYFNIVSYVVGAKAGYFGGPAWGEKWAKDRGQAKLQLGNLDILEMKGANARVRVEYFWKAPLFRSQNIQEELTLERHKAPFNPEESIWQIVPSPVVPRTDLRESALVFNTTANTVVSARAVVEGYMASTATSHLKTLGLAVLQFVQDYDEEYAFAPEYATMALLPYMRTDANAWDIPGTENKFRFNANLSGKTLAKVDDAAKTVLFYDGDGGTLNFRFGGKAAVGFADGHVALLTPEEAKDLVWKVEP